MNYFKITWTISFFTAIAIISINSLFAKGNNSPIFSSDSNLQIVIPGDADNNGILDMDDAKLIVRYVMHQVSALQDSVNTDVNQDGKITIDDAYTIAMELTGSTRIVTAGPDKGILGKAEIGTLVRIDVYEKFFPHNITGGTVRIVSDSKGYDSGIKPLTFQRDGRSLYYLWETGGLSPSTDYKIFVSLTDKNTLKSAKLVSPSDNPNASITIDSPCYEDTQLTQSQDSYTSSPGLSMAFIRTFQSNHEYLPFLRPLGYGWWHNYEIHLSEETDGSVLFVNGFGSSRRFTSNSNGTYTSSIGDYAKMSRNQDGSFVLREKNGLSYIFRSDLLFDFMEDLNRNKISASYNVQNQLIKVTHSNGAYFQFEYNSSGRISKFIDQAGRVTNYVYDADSTHLIRVEVPGNRITSYTYCLGQSEIKNHRLSSITFPDSTHQFFAYDSLARISTREGSWGTGKIKYSYDADGTTYISDSLGNTTTIKVNQKGQPVEITNPLGYKKQYMYDNAFNLIQSIDQDGLVNQFEYDGKGNMTRMVDPLDHEIIMSYEPDFNKLTSLKDSRGAVTGFQYNGDGNLIKITYPDGSEEGFDYTSNGSLLSKTDRNGNMITYSYNPQGLLLNKIYPDSSKVEYTYDANGNMTSSSNYTGTISFKYDELDRQIEATYPGNRTFHYQYDRGNKRTRMTDPDGKVQNYKYDGAGRLYRITDSLDSTIVEYWYDVANRRAGKGLVNGIYTTYTYDVAGQLLELNTYNKKQELVSFFHYTYDSNGNRLTKESVDGTETYTYDELNQLTKVFYPDATTEQFIYDEMGNRHTVLSGGNLISYTANNLNQYGTVGTATYKYDKNGNLISKTESGKATKYLYDWENRLYSVQTPTDTIGYSYNPFGLRNSQTKGGKITKYLWDGDVVGLEENEANKTQASYTWGGNLDEAIQMKRDSSLFYYTQDAMLSTSDIFNSDGLPVEHYKYKAFGEPQIVSGIENPWYYTGLNYDFNIGLQYNRLRFYNPQQGRFISCDPINVSGGINLYSYVLNQPFKFIDPYGTSIEGHILDFVGKIFDLNYCGEHTSGGQYIEHGQIGDITVKPKNWFDDLCRTHDIEWLKLGREQANKNVINNVIDHFFPKNKTERNVSGSGNNGGIGGTCPTFIQLPSEFYPTKQKDKPTLSNSLTAKITVPISNALLRSDIPVFGIAGGKNFKSYRVEYGKGMHPKAWHIIESSTAPQNKNNVGIEQIPAMQGDIDIHGNLATWNTGLKNWVHLPWHPAEDTTDFNGVYTIRLVVEGTDGTIAKDSVTCEVGRALAQCLPGIAISPDKKVIMHFPEQALTSPFRVYTILPTTEANEEKPALSENAEFIGKVYRIREPGDRFAKAVKLEFSITKTELNNKNLQNIGLVQYDFNQKKWMELPSEYRVSNDLVFFSTMITELPAPKAFYALVFDKSGTKRSQLKIETAKELASIVPVSKEVLINNTFDDNAGMWKARDLFVGAQVSIDDKNTPNGSKALKISGTNQGGNFSVTAVDQSFDVKEYPVLSFDYKVEAGVKTDFYLLINDRWYNLGFTGNLADFSHADVNIANLESFDKISADNQWHSVSINLYELIRQKTKHTKVDAMIMADWHPGGYMKLDFGNNSRTASYYIDNFKISSGPKYEIPDVVVVDDFNANKANNLLGGANGSFTNAGTDYIQVKVDIIESSQKSKSKVVNTNGLLKLKFDASVENAYCGYWTSLIGKDFTDMKELHFLIRTDGAIPPLLAGLRHASQTVESAVLIQKYLSKPDKDGWCDVAIPLTAFIGNGLPDLRSMDVLFFKFENKISSGKGTVFIDDVQILNNLSNASVISFNNPSDEKNKLGGGSRVISQSAATISSNYFEDILASNDSIVHTLRISYGGTIGLSYGGRNFSYAMWETDLMGIDASKYKHVVLKIRGQKGGELPNIYLDDACRRACLRPMDFPAISNSWQNIRLPLKRFADLGVDLTHLDKLQITFEWKEMSGTIYLDEIYFE